MSEDDPSAKIAESTSWVEKGVYGTALVALGEGLVLCEATENPAANRERFVAKMAERVAHPTLSAAAAEAEKKWAKARRILSMGTRFEWEEFVQILTLRIEAELIMSVLAVFGIEIGEVNLHLLDDDLRTIGATRGNEAEFLSAIRSVQENWGIPIKDRWSKAPS